MGKTKYIQRNKELERKKFKSPLDPKLEAELISSYIYALDEIERLQSEFIKIGNALQDCMALCEKKQGIIDIMGKLAERDNPRFVAEVIELLNQGAQEGKVYDARN